MSTLPEDYTLIGLIQKPYGLLGEVKVKPETFDFNRYTSLKKVFSRGASGDLTALTIRASRADTQFWYFKFDDFRTPEAVAFLSGTQLLIDSSEKLELPEGMVYFSDLPGMSVRDEEGATVGEVVEVLETGALEYLVVRSAKGDIQVPWNDHFVKKIDKAARVVEMDLSQLRGILL